MECTLLNESYISIEGKGASALSVLIETLQQAVNDALEGGPVTDVKASFFTTSGGCECLGPPRRAHRATEKCPERK